MHSGPEYEIEDEAPHPEGPDQGEDPVGVVEVLHGPALGPNQDEKGELVDQDVVVEVGRLMSEFVSPGCS